MKLKTALGGVAALTAASLTLTACGRADDTASGPSEAVTLDDSPAEGTITVWAMGAEGEALGGFKRRKCAMWEVGQPRSRSHGPFGGELPRPSGSNPWATRQASGDMMRQDG